ncbi:hypothetical protein [Spiroplasma taiwanense]|uniref:Uncharacterized protein n=1 Tax=Spiroplasma taiwanense CT-1 TaxID=1276220 RepID=S5LZK4_9MOLU|nr:hypothetical protein [Spiroplasma taiwanense]AGR41142.1 hypothetical protein STAIW_v1c05090 [Spiroplasma taiwanense CT-1]
MENKVYNLKKSSLGKMEFVEGTSFLMIAGIGDNDKIFREILIVKSSEDAIKKFPSWSMETIYTHISDKSNFHNSVVNWLIENWLDEGIITFKNSMYENFGYDEFKQMDPIEFIKSEPEMVPLCLVHIAVRFTNGYLKIPVNELEISIRFVKNVLGINFWEEGNPKSNEPQM